MCFDLSKKRWTVMAYRTAYSCMSVEARIPSLETCPDLDAKLQDRTATCYMSVEPHIPPSETSSTLVAELKDRDITTTIMKMQQCRDDILVSMTQDFAKNEYRCCLCYESRYY
eukprot:c25025_g4_i1 orf=250-588(+)